MNSSSGIISWLVDHGTWTRFFSIRSFFAQVQEPWAANIHLVNSPNNGNVTGAVCWFIRFAQTIITTYHNTIWLTQNVHHGEAVVESETDEESAQTELPKVGDERCGNTWRWLIVLKFYLQSLLCINSPATKPIRLHPARAGILP